MTVAEQHPLKQILDDALDSLADFKKLLYPTEGPKRSLPDHFPKKSDIKKLSSCINKCHDPATKLIKSKQPKTNKTGGGTTLVYIEPKMAKFLKLKEKGLGDVYSNTLVTKFFTSYFQIHNLCKSIYIIPDDDIKELFHQSLETMGVVDKNGKLLERLDKAGNKYKGFKFIEAQGIFTHHMLTDQATGHRLKVDLDADPTNKKLVYELIQKEDKAMDEITNLRSDIKHAEDQLVDLTAKKDIAGKCGDDDNLKELQLNVTRNIKKMKKDLISACSEALFPLPA